MPAVSRDRLSILTYHSIDDSGSVVSVSPALFAAQMEELAARGVKTMTLGAAGEARRRDGHWPQNAVVITFDDGYANVVEHALPVLSRHGFVATMFVISGHVGGQNDWAPRPPQLPPLPIASWDQLRKLDDSGWELAAHTHTHPDLRRLSAADIETEFLLCNEDIAANIGRVPASFAYPYGWYSPLAADLAATTYNVAVTTKLARARTESGNLLPRIDMFYIRTPTMLSQIVQGKCDRYLALRCFGRRITQWLS